jgi:hypothetical protein
VLQVNRYQVPADGWDDASAPRAWRISTPDGVFWLAEDGADTRLIRLPVPSEVGDLDTLPNDETWTSCEMLALAAETEAASRWTRAVLASHGVVVGEDPA